MYVYRTLPGITDYEWSCTVPNEDGLRFLPDIRITYRDEQVSTTDGNVLHVFQPVNLSEECYGSVAAIEYCYRYNTTGQGEAFFNWTLLILEDFKITDKYFLESQPGPFDPSQLINGEMAVYCDILNMTRFLLPNRNFKFAVTTSAQGNARGATLLGFADALPDYRVPVMQISKESILSLSVGSNVTETRLPKTNRGVRMLWFVTGKQHL